MPFAPFAEDFVPKLHARPSHRFTRPFICDYLTEAPRRIDNGEPDELETLASPFDPIVPPAPSREARLVAHAPLSPAPTVRPELRKTPRAPVRAPVVQTYQPLTPETYWGRPEVKRPAPIARPRQAPAAAVEPPYPAYLRQQFTKLQAPVTQQVGALSPPPGLARVPSGLGYKARRQQHINAYIQAQVNDVQHVQSTPPLRHPTPTRSTPPAWIHIKTPKPERVPTPGVPDIPTLLQGMDVPTWDKLDEFATQAREWLALRAALDPQGYAVRHNQVTPVGRSIVPDIALLEGLNIPTWADLDVIAKYLKEWFALRALLDPQGYTMRRAGTAPKVTSEEYGIEEAPVIAGSPQVEEWTFPAQGSQAAPSTVLSIPTQVLSDPMSDSASDSHSFLSYRLAEQELALGLPIQSPDDSVKQLELMAKELDFRARAFVLPDRLDFIPYELHPAEYKGVPGMYQDSSNNEGFLEYSAFLDEAYGLLTAVPTWGYKSIQLPRKKLLDRVVDEENMLYRMRVGLWEMESCKQERLREMEKLKGLYWTSFPAPAPSPDQLNRPEQPAPALRTKSRAAGPTPVSPEESHLYYYFCIDDRLLYLSFFEDWGPLNLAQVYRACILIHELLQDANLKRHRIVLYSSNDPRRRANSALLMALYCMIVQRRTPWEVFYPIAEVEFMPFRDAGRGRSDFHLGIQDCLWGVWKAQHNHLLDMNEFSVDEYEYYEKVDNGDWNWITPGFIAFASPVDSVWIRQQKEGKTKPGGATSSVSALQRKLPNPFVNVLEYFSERNVKLVVRLNNELYDKAVFEERGIEHLDLYFDDGTNPADEITRTFIAKSDAIIEAGGAVAVHCKAGLGRTGTLIGAYLIYKYGFTASEAIGFMRIVRPGSVVGPQQQFMYMKQLEWAKWAAVDEIRKAEAQRVEVPTPRTPPEELRPMSTGSTNAASASPVRTAQSVAPSSPRAATPPGLMSSPVIANTVPVTPHKARPTTPIKTDGPVLQPRKTPAAKRAATGDEEVEDEGDQLGVLGVGFRRVSGKRTAGGDAASASRSEAGSRVRREGAVGSSSKSDSGPRLPAGAMSVDRGKSTGIGLGRATRSSTRMVAKRAAEIEASLAPAPTPQVTRPRLLTHATTANGAAGGVSRIGQATAALKNASARHAPSSSVSSVPGNTRRPAAPPGSPQLPKYNTRSKLPMPSAGPMGPTTTSGLKVPQKRAYVLTPPPPLPLPLLAEKGKKAGEEGKEKEDEDPEWTHGEGANAVVVPGSKLERPNLRSVRRRRSSFSAADIIT